MKTLTFSGSSDDVFCVEGKGIGDEAYISSRDSTGAFKVGNDHTGCFVVGTYAPDVTGVGCWSVGIMPLEEDIALPDWPVRFALGKNGYSAALILEAPDDVKVKPVTDA